MILNGQTPIIIAHRGASSYRPEHTLAAYELAIEMGADYIEPDLVSTADGILIARHENALAIVDPITNILIEATTNVANLPQFADRLSTKTIARKKITGWFSENFTAQEIREFIRARERIPNIRPHNTRYNDRFVIPTLPEIIDLVKRKSLEINRTIGIYPETKHPSYFKSIGLALEELLVRILITNGYEDKNAPIFIQSFEVSSLQKLKILTNLPLIQLIGDSGKPCDTVNLSYAEMIQFDGLAQISTYAKGIGVSKNLVISRDKENNLLSHTDLVHHAHAVGLLVHAYTFRNETVFLPRNLKDNPEEEYRCFYQTGIDGLFSDCPDTAFQVRSTSGNRQL